MDATTDKIIRLTSGFYEQNAASFSATRSKAWTGWKRVLDHLGPGRISGPLLDAACGNLRFEAALEQAHYLLVKRSGFVASETYAKEQLRKRDLYVMQAGSCFRTRFEGDVYDVSDGGSHPVYRYAKPLLMEVIS